MKVHCMICGFVGHVTDYHIWQGERRYPDVWICDICYVELQ